MQGIDSSIINLVKIYADKRDIHLSPETFADLEESGNNVMVEGVIRAGAKAGITLHFVKKPLEKVHPLTLPVILVLKDKTSCLLMEKDSESAELIFPDGPLKTLSMDEISSVYSGFCFFLGKEPQPEPDRQPGESRGWFINAVKLSLPIYRDVIIASITINLFVLAVPMFTMNVYDRVVPNFATETLWVLASGVMVVLLFDGLLKFLRVNFIELAAKKSDMVISSMIFEKVMDLKMEAAPLNVGGFASNIKEFDSIKNFLSSSVILFFIDLPFALFFLWVIFYVGGALVFVPMIFMSLLLIYVLIIKKPLFASIAASFEESTRKSALLIESVAGLREIKVLIGSSRFQRQWEALVASLARHGIRSRKLSSSITIVMGLFIALDSVFIVIYGVYLIHEGLLSMGGLIAVMILSSRAIGPMGQVASLLSSYDQTRVAYDSIRHIMELPIETGSEKRFIQKDRLEGGIEFKDVVFTYPGAEKPALQNISFTIAPKERVAILGANGSGKSTLHQLILGLYNAQDGIILRDGLDIRSLHPRFLRRETAYVPQDFILFSGTIGSNLTMKNPAADDSDLLRAVEIGGISPLINSHSLGLNAPVIEKGANFSGGQRQGIAIARAFITPCSMILLDEPTSHMDGASEQGFVKRMAESSKDSTLVVSSHKNALLSLVDRVIVLHEGRIIFDGIKEKFFEKFFGGPGIKRSVSASSSKNEVKNNDSL